jgi:hypothetical protein
VGKFRVLQKKRSQIFGAFVAAITADQSRIKEQTNEPAGFRPSAFDTVVWRGSNDCQISFFKRKTPVTHVKDRRARAEIQNLEVLMAMQSHVAPPIFCQKKNIDRTRCTKGPNVYSLGASMRFKKCKEVLVRLCTL